MSHSYKGEPTPASVKFKKVYRLANRSGMVEVGKTIQLDGLGHVVKRITKVDIQSDVVTVWGKAAPIQKGDKGDEKRNG